MSRDAWLEERRKSIGGSDAPSIIGLNPWQSPYTVWADKLGKLPPKEDNEAMRLGPLEELLADETVNEIMVNGPGKVYIERGGKLVLSDCQFTDDASVLSVIERIVSPLGRRIDESQPYVDARLADGSRVNAIIAPLALSGPTITIRKTCRMRTIRMRFPTRMTRRITTSQ